MHLSPTPDQKAKEVWKLMDEDMRAFVKSLVDVGLMDGRAGLAKCRVAVLPDRLVWAEGVQPCITSREEAEIMQRGKRK